MHIILFVISRKLARLWTEFLSPSRTITSSNVMQQKNSVIFEHEINFAISLYERWSSKELSNALRDTVDD